MKPACLLIFLVAGCKTEAPAPATQTETPAPDAAGWGKARAAPSAIAAGKTLWLDSMPDDTQYPLIHASVDIGSMTVKGDELEISMKWPSQPGPLGDFRRAHPELSAPDGAYEREIKRVQCRADGPFSYSIEESMHGPDGKELLRYPIDPAVEKAKHQAEWDEKEKEPFSTRLLPYRDDAASFACAALAAKCRGESLAWPPPPNLTPLEHSQRAHDMRRAYALRFIPHCKP